MLFNRSRSAPNVGAIGWSSLQNTNKRGMFKSMIGETVDDESPAPFI
jgi:hypothetical protein